MATTNNLRRWQWTAFLLGTLWVSIGCTPATLTYFFMPFSDDSVPAKCKLAKKKEVTVCVVTNFAGLEIRPETAPADRELAELFVQQLRKRAEDNKEKIKFVPLDKVRSYQNQADFATRPLHEVGKHFNADYVVALEISSLSLYEKGSSQLLLRGNSDINVQVIDVHQPAGEATIFTEPYRREFPASGPREASQPQDGPRFRRLFLNAVANDLARLFTATPKDERFQMD